MTGFKVQSRRLLLHTAHVLSKKSKPTENDIREHVKAFAEYLRDITGDPRIGVFVGHVDPPQEAAEFVPPTDGGGQPPAAAAVEVPVN